MENCAKEPLSQRLKILFTNKQTWFVALYACLLWAPMSGFTSLWGVPFLIKADHYSNESAALLTSMMWIGLAVASPLLGYISTRFGTRKHCLTLSALIGAIAFALVLYMQLPAIWVGVLLFIAGGACAGQALSFTVVKENNNPQISATAIAVNNMAVVISGAIFQPLIGWFLNGHAVHVAAEYREALSVILIAYLVGFAVSQIFIKETI